MVCSTNHNGVEVILSIFKGTVLTGITNAAHENSSVWLIISMAVTYLSEACDLLQENPLSCTCSIDSMLENLKSTETSTELFVLSFKLKKIFTWILTVIWSVWMKELSQYALE